MTPAEVIASLPDDQELSTGLGTVLISDLRAAFCADAAPAYISTKQASERFGFVPAYWEAFARGCDGAVGGRSWKIPLDACAAHMKERAQKTENGREHGATKRRGRPLTSSLSQGRR